MATITDVTTDDGKTTKYRVRYYGNERDEHGRLKVKTETFSKETDAEKRKRKIESQKDDGVLVVPSKETFSDFLNRWLTDTKSGRIADRTLDDYRNIVRRYITKPPKGAPRLGEIKLHKLTAANFEKLYEYLWRELRLAPRTLQYIHSVLRQALRRATTVGDLAKNPTEGVTPQSHAFESEDDKGLDDDDEKVKSMTEEEAGRFLGAATDDRYHALWCILLMCGLRPSEALALRWSAVDLEKGKVQVRRSLTRRGVSGPWKLTAPKTKKGRRTLPLPPVLVGRLKEWRRQQSAERLLVGAEYDANDFVFANEFGKPLHRNNLSRRNFQRILKAAELGIWEGEGKQRRFRPAFRMYDLRHTCATLLIKRGVAVHVVSERLGHSKTSFTYDTYVSVIKGQQEAASEEMEAMFGTGA